MDAFNVMMCMRPCMHRTRLAVKSVSLKQFVITVGSGPQRRSEEQASSKPAVGHMSGGMAGLLGFLQDDKGAVHLLSFELLFPSQRTDF